MVRRLLHLRKPFLGGVALVRSRIHIFQECTRKSKCRFISVSPPQYEILSDVALESDAFGKFVRINLTGEIVEVVSFDLTEITISFKGRNLIMNHYEVSRITPEEAAAATRILG